MHCSQNNIINKTEVRFHGHVLSVCPKWCSCTNTVLYICVKLTFLLSNFHFC